MGMTLIEKIITNHSNQTVVRPGDIVDVSIDARVARDFGGASVVKNLQEKSLGIDDPSKTFFTFDCNPTGSDQKYAVNQHICRIFARENNIRVYDIDSGIGTHLLIDEGLVFPGATAISTDSHANILGAVGAFGQGMGDKDIAAAWNKGKIWFKVPKSVKIILEGKFPEHISAKDIVLNLLSLFGANKLLGYSVEIYGDDIDSLSLDERITISSMGTEMGAIIILFPPNEEIMAFCQARVEKPIAMLEADADAMYEETFRIDVSKFVSQVSKPGKPHDTAHVSEVKKVKIDSAFIGSCTNGRIEDMRITAGILKDRKVAPGVVLKIVPSTDQVWQQCLNEGILKVFKESGAMVSNAGCAGCAAGQVGQNGPGEVTISTGNRNFPGKQGKGDVYLASPSVVAASAIAGYITTADDIPEEPALFHVEKKSRTEKEAEIAGEPMKQKSSKIRGEVWLITQDNIDTDMIYHNRYLAITDMKEMGQYTFDNLEGFEDFAKKANPGDIIITGKNFGSGSSRQQAVDCFKSLGVQAVIAESFGAIYERNAINAAFPILVFSNIHELDLEQGNQIEVDLNSGLITNLENSKSLRGEPFSDVQMEIYQNGGLF